MKAVIITIGDEILIGQTIDTNAAWLGREFNQRGVQVEKIISIRDDEQAIHAALNEGFALAEIIIMTGGLGPTLDDITKQSLCSYFDTNLVLSEESLACVKELVESRGFFVNENNHNQAMLPACCHPIRNHLGTAPVMQFEKAGRLLFSMPGVPFEMKHAMINEVFPIIESRFSLSPVFHQTIMTFGIPEAFLAERLTNWVAALPEYIKIAYLPSPEGIKIRLSVYETNFAEWKQEVAFAVNQLKKEIPENIFSVGEKSIEQALSEILRANGLSLSTAESCTGGLIGHLITSIPGSSDIYKGGLIAYSNEIKEQILNVNSHVLAHDGAVSENCVREMSQNIVKLFNTDCGISVSGIAGPDGGTDDKPVGTVWISVVFGNEMITEKFSLGTKRDIITRKAASTGMYMLYKLVKMTVINS